MKLSAINYKDDRYYTKVVKAMDDELVHSNHVSPISIFQRMQLLDKADVEKWRSGKIPFLEKAITCNLGKASRILQLVRFYAHDLNMKPSLTIYKRKARSGKQDLRFTKTGDKKIEEAYSRSFVKTAKQQESK